MRYHIHLCLTADAIAERDASLTVSLNANDDVDAQAFVMDLLPDLEFDIQDIDEEES